ncbi:MAG: cytidylate kinase family protein [Clostridia bacterium]|nr:cytidylate kinase family protein [Clostridia bacterium]
MADFRISLAGDLGSGKSTVGKLLGRKFGAEIISVGKMQRNIAAELGMDVTQFNLYQESHPEFDKMLDGKIAEYDKLSGSFIFDSRLAWHFAPSAFSVYLKCGLEESAKRILAEQRNDECYSSIEEAKYKITERRKSEKERYLSFYGVDITDMKNYDLVVDTVGKTPEQVAEEIVCGWEKYNLK